MKKILVTLAVAGLLTSSAFGQAAVQVTFSDLDADASGELSLTELQMAWPQIAEADFSAADLDLSGGLNASEVTALQAAAIAPLPGADRPAQGFRASPPPAPAEITSPESNWD